MNNHIIVIGGGLAGLTFSWEAVRRGYRVTLLERREDVGGLLDTVEKDGYKFDSGGSHIIFSRDREKLNYLINIVGRNNLFRHFRDTRIFYKRRYVKYPFENGIYMLSREERYEILKSVIDTYIKRLKGELRPPENFYEWIFYVFGEAIADKYLVPYNEKIWKRDLHEISLDWVKGRVPLPPIDDIIKSAVGIPTIGYKHQAVFYYPKRGGIRSLIEGILKRLSRVKTFQLITDVIVSAITNKRRSAVVHTDRGDFEGGIVVSTAPLTQSLSYLDEGYSELSKKLDYNSLVVVGIGVKRKTLPYHWVYFPQPDISFHRLAILSNYSSYMAKRGGSTLLAEVSFPPKSRVDLNKTLRKVIEDLLYLEILKEGDIDIADAWVWEHAYIVYRKGYSDAVAKAKKVLLRHGVVPLGRFGSWRYINMDETAYQAVETARDLKNLTLLYQRRDRER